MLPIFPLPQSHERPARQLAEALMETVTELSEVIAEENMTLASGFPAGLAQTSERKNLLAAEYAELWEDLGAEGAAALVADVEFGRTMIAAVNELRQATAENIVRLEAAMAASRRRVEAVLEALRQDARVSANYSAKGDIPLDLRLPPAGANFHA